ncbi:hypothetical protein AB0I54_41985 [Streptomyces sp. NPDC050625]|uniref:hypothetical protein n=1 Tax=Streptomyces sp. NPDC050625 TaxID=3154629 RepID=UPI00341B11B8
MGSRFHKSMTLWAIEQMLHRNGFSHQVLTLSAMCRGSVVAVDNGKAIPVGWRWCVPLRHHASLPAPWVLQTAPYARSIPHPIQHSPPLPWPLDSRANTPKA